MRSDGVLLLGGTGFVGKCLAARLKTLGKKCYIVGRNASMIHNEVSGDYYVSSLDNIQMLKELLPRCRVVIHLASDTTPGASVLQPTLEVTSNLLPSLRLLEELQKYSHLSLVYVSTGGAIYGDYCGDKATEEMQVLPQSYYGAGKAAFEQFIHAYVKQTGNHAIILRPSNLYGPGQPYRPGFGIIPTIFHHLSNSKTMEVWGDGEIVRDYLYIDDFIDCCVKIINDLHGEYKARVYNVGSGNGTSLNTLFNMIESISTYKVKRNYSPVRAVDVNKVVLDGSRIQNDYHWKSKTDLCAGLLKAWTWFQAHTQLK